MSDNTVFDTEYPDFLGSEIQIRSENKAYFHVIPVPLERNRFLWWGYISRTSINPKSILAIRAMGWQK